MTKKTMAIIIPVKKPLKNLVLYPICLFMRINGLKKKLSCAFAGVRIKKRPITPFLTISLLIHMAIFISVPAVKTTGCQEKKPDIFDVDLKTEPVHELHKKTEKTVYHPEKSLFKPLEQNTPHEATVSLNDKNMNNTRYSSYLDHLRYRINSTWEYPDAAKEKAMEGNLTLCFSLDRNGRIKGIKITEPSQYGILNNEAIRAIKHAAPFKPFPKEFTISKLNVIATFSYRYSNI